MKTNKKTDCADGLNWNQLTMEQKLERTRERVRFLERRLQELEQAKFESSHGTYF